mmetsp:Transcript_41723/g.90964  ORF Transcript_41723/g.90964 Transcript_41723/m.90964 type:complete len:138 (+) Transcript_41723:702-1115(+)
MLLPSGAEPYEKFKRKKPKYFYKVQRVLGTSSHEGKQTPCSKCERELHGKLLLAPSRHLKSVERSERKLQHHPVQEAVFTVQARPQQLQAALFPEGSRSLLTCSPPTTSSTPSEWLRLYILRAMIKWQSAAARWLLN